MEFFSWGVFLLVTIGINNSGSIHLDASPKGQVGVFSPIKSKVKFTVLNRPPPSTPSCQSSHNGKWWTVFRLFNNRGKPFYHQNHLYSLLWGNTSSPETLKALIPLFACWIVRTNSYEFLWIHTQFLWNIWRYTFESINSTFFHFSLRYPLKYNNL